MSNFSSYMGYKTKNSPQKWFLTVLNHLPVNKLPFCCQKFDKNSSRKLANLIPICLDFYLFATQFWPSRFLENQDWRHLLWQSHFWFRSENLNWICHFRQKKVCRGACNYCLHHNKVFCAFYFALSKCGRE